MPHFPQPFWSKLLFSFFNRSRSADSPDEYPDLFHRAKRQKHLDKWFRGEPNHFALPDVFFFFSLPIVVRRLALRYVVLLMTTALYHP
jgi:hypothetical protein